MHMTVSGNQLLISKEQEEFFKYIKNNEIELDIKIGNNTELNVLKNKSLEKDRLDITKLSKIKDNLDNCTNKKVLIKNITFELECI